MFFFLHLYLERGAVRCEIAEIKFVKWSNLVSANKVSNLHLYLIAYFYSCQNIDAKYTRVHLILVFLKLYHNWLN